MNLIQTFLEAWGGLSALSLPRSLPLPPPEPPLALLRFDLADASAFTAWAGFLDDFCPEGASFDAERSDLLTVSDGRESADLLADSDGWVSAYLLAPDWLLAIALRCALAASLSALVLYSVCLWGLLASGLRPDESFGQRADDEPVLPVVLPCMVALLRVDWFLCGVDGLSNWAKKSSMSLFRLFLGLFLSDKIIPSYLDYPINYIIYMLIVKWKCTICWVCSTYDSDNIVLQMCLKWNKM